MDLFGILAVLGSYCPNSLFDEKIDFFLSYVSGFCCGNHPVKEGGGGRVCTADSGNWVSASWPITLYYHIFPHLG